MGLFHFQKMKYNSQVSSSASSIISSKTNTRISTVAQVTARLPGIGGSSPTSCNFVLVPPD